MDVVLEPCGKPAGVEVKAGAAANAADFKGLCTMPHAAGARLAADVVLHDGDAVAPLGWGLHAAPLTRFREER